MVWEVAQAVKLPILGMGGVAKEDAAQLLLAGASAVAVGTACLTIPMPHQGAGRSGGPCPGGAPGLNKVSDLPGRSCPGEWSARRWSGTPVI